MSDRLERTLAELADQIVWPEPSSQLATRVSARLEPRRSRWRWRVAATLGAMAVLAGVLALSPSTRRAVADLLAMAGIEIRMTQQIPAAGAGLDLGGVVTLDEAGGRAGFEVRVPSVPGPPDGVYLDGDRVHMVWGGTEVLPAAGDTGVGLLLTQYRPIDGSPAASKAIGAGSRVSGTDIDGTAAIWIEGAPHTLTLLDEHGEPRTETTRLAANVLLWEFDGVAFRLETTGGLDAALTVAGSTLPSFRP